MEPNFPEWARKQKAASLENALKVIEGAQDQPKLKSLALPKH